ncbi:transmembrane protein, putative (macronuclear) [Tetrahymena thermophila SB210]|uniref:Transmembrane protein, putative n=1 Tax=Tetrahymena thermophila (strain SB210) TaxID=312017 RepID=I7M758_TETTS|nr:transmembrane protein, putative [Tetrahymena thermophila SB210]EAR89904.2 transmembrane protein, putative [Tetrahymena thermophila SB210]|eukprot:XP_001010149.2 transmembrane protein, putative [Tetrahymena thermophila SB210]
MKINFLLVTFIIELHVITKGLDVLPIQIQNDIIFIQETNSLIYQAQSDSTYRYSNINKIGVILSTYLLNGLNNIDIHTKYYLVNDVIYLFYYGITSYQTIDLNLMTTGQSGYLKTLSYPTATYPCTISNLQIQNIGTRFYYLCFDSSNIFLVQSSTFQKLFTTSTKTSGKIMKSEKTYIILDDYLYTNGTIYDIQLSFPNTQNILLINMQWSLYLIDDYLTKVQIIDSTFKDNKYIKLNNSPNSNLVSDVIEFQTIFIIIAYDSQRKAFRYFNVENLQELQSTGVNLPFIDYQTFLQYQEKIFIGQYSYQIAYISSNNQVQVTQNPQVFSQIYKLPYTHLVNYAFSYFVTFQAMLGSNQYLINIYQAYNFCIPQCQICASMTTCQMCQSPYYLDIQFQCIDKCPNQFVSDNTNIICICRPNSSLQNQACPCNTTFFDSNGSCLSCPQNCLTCTSQKNCQVCQTSYLNLDGTCVQSCPNHFIKDQNKCICRLNSTLQNSSCPCNDGYVDINDICQPCPPNCKICNNQLVCTACAQNYYLTVQETCVLSCPPLFIPDATNTKCTCRLNSNLQNQQCPCNSGYVDINNVCMQCPANCKECASQSVCKVCAQDFYLSVQQTCVSSCPETFIIDSTSTKCVCDVNKILQNGTCSDKCNSNNCQTCDKNNNQICTVCNPGFDLYGQICQQVYLNYGSQIFSSDKIEQIHQQTQIISEGAQYSSILQNFLQSFISSSSFSIAQNSINVQKFVFILLVDTNLPQQIYSLLQPLKEKTPSQQMKYLNLFQSAAHESQVQYSSARFKSADLASYILLNNGTGIILFIILMISMTLSFILIQKVKHKNVQYICKKAYEIIICSLIIQYIQISVFILVIGINSQLIYYIKGLSAFELGVEITFLIISIMITAVFYYKIYFYLNTKSFQSSNKIFFEITKQKIENNTRKTSKLSKNFILIYLITETLIIPTCFIQLSQNYFAPCIIAITISMVQLVLVVYSMPFQSKLTNAYFIVNYILWNFFYIFFLILVMYSQKKDIIQYRDIIDIISYIIIIIILTILIEQPIYFLLLIITKLYHYFKQKSKVNQELELEYFQKKSQHSLDLQQKFLFYPKQHLSRKVRESFSQLEVRYTNQLYNLALKKIWIKSGNQNQQINKNI